MSQTQLPNEAITRLTDIVRLHQIPIEQLISECNREINTNFIQGDATLPTFEDKAIYASKVIKGRYLTRPPLKNTQVVVLGISPIRVSRAGDAYGDLFCLHKDKDKNVMKRISLNARAVENAKNVQAGFGYTVALGIFKNGGDFVADERSVFENPIALGPSLHDLLKIAGVKRITIKDVPYNTSRIEKTATGSFTDRSDWRMIRGIVGNFRKGQRKDSDNVEWGVYTISDDSLTEAEVTPDGTKMVQPAFTVWVNPLWLAFGRGSEVDFAGPISVNSKTKECQMDGYALIGLHTREVEES